MLLSSILLVGTTISLNTITTNNNKDNSNNQETTILADLTENYYYYTKEDLKKKINELEQNLKDYIKNLEIKNKKNYFIIEAKDKIKPFTIIASYEDFSSKIKDLEKLIKDKNGFNIVLFINKNKINYWISPESKLDSYTIDKVHEIIEAENITFSNLLKVNNKEINRLILQKTSVTIANEIGSYYSWIGILMILLLSGIIIILLILISDGIRRQDD